MIFSFPSYPLVRLCLAFALGIVSYHYLDLKVLLPVWFLVFCFICYVFLAKTNSLKYHIVNGFLVLVILFGIGSWRLKLYQGIDQKEHIVNLDSLEVSHYKAQILEQPVRKSNTFNVVLSVYQVNNADGWQSAKGLVNTYVDTLTGAQLKYGELLFVTGKWTEISPPANPGEFDYKGYLEYQNIYKQHFLREPPLVLGYLPPNEIEALAISFSQRCQEIFKERIPNERSRSIALALVLGVKNELDDTTVQAYAATGAMHVLAVSGLHVGIVYLIFMSIIKRIGLQDRKYRWMVAAISLLVLWSFALLTGLSPSVLRAVTMFSFFAMARAMFRKTNIYNTLAASALVLLLYNPYLIMSVGFQLSYLAVFGIVYLQPKLYGLFSTKYWLLDKIWAITCVSIAAQVATGPLSLMYFHQFPNYFLFSNLFIIPAATVILIGGILVLLTNFLSGLSIFLGKVLSGFITGTNWAVDWVSSWPGGLSEGLQMTILETWSFYMIIIFILLFLTRMKLSYLKAAIVLAIVFSSSQLFNRAPFLKSTEMSVLNVSNATVFDIRAGRATRVFGDSTFIKDEERIRFHLQPKRLLANAAYHPADDDLEIAFRTTPVGELITFNGESLLKLNNPTEFELSDTLAFKTILIEEVPNDLKILHFLQAEEFIISPKIPYYRERKLLAHLDSLGVNYHHVRTHGYYSKLWKK